MKWYFIDPDCPDEPDPKRWSGTLRVRQRALWSIEDADEIKSKNWDPAARMVITSRCKPQDVPEPDVLYLVMSERARRVVDRVSPNSVQWLPIRMMSGRRELTDVGPYWMPNVLYSAPCMPGFDGPHYKIGLDRTEADLDKSVIPKGVHILRPTQWVSTILASQRLRDAMKKARISGVKFSAVKW